MAYIKSKFPGVRYREHPSRKHGVKPDRYFSYDTNWAQGQGRGAGLGSEGMTEAKAGPVWRN